MTFSKCSKGALGLHLEGTRDWWEESHIKLYLIHFPPPTIKFLQPALHQPFRGPYFRRCQKRQEDCRSLHLKYRWRLFPCPEPSSIKERGRWMSDPCIWHLISAASDLGFDLVSLSESLRKQSLLSSLNKFMHWRTIYLLWQFYYSEQWAVLVVQYFGFSLSFHVDKQKHSVWQLKRQ